MEAWSLVNIDKRNKANEIADKLIKEWEVQYA